MLCVGNLLTTVHIKMRFCWVEQRAKLKKIRKQILIWQLKSQNKSRAGYNNDRSNKTGVSEGDREQKKVSDKHIQGGKLLTVTRGQSCGSARVKLEGVDHHLWV